MKQVTLSLKDKEYEAFLEIMQVKNIPNLHRAIKIAIEDYIKRFKENRG